MLYSTLLFALTAFSAVASAQDVDYPKCCSVDPGSVPLADRQMWCQAQRNTCPQICGGIGKLANPGGNFCDVNTLNYTCACADGNKPNMSDYQQSVPALMCHRWFDNCIAHFVGDQEGQHFCQQIQCGNKTAAEVVSTSSAAASSTPTGSSGGNAPSATSPAPSAATSKGAAVALGLAREYGTPALAAGLMAVFGFAL